ncbi:hypothetical protein ACIODW_19045 [Streptomyces sp. NPDC087897]|uniref:hypothetical protein n=1 Tax=Streptomyces sp. NPDC087897 TaxID=3365817 RepID=UPI0038281C28
MSGVPASGGGRGIRRVVLTALPVVLVLGAVGGAAGYAKNAVDSADRTAATTVWDEDHAPDGKDPTGDPSRGRHDTELTRLLLPVPKGYRLGPDIGEFGNDSETSGAKAAAAMKEMGRGLAGKDRRELNKSVEKLRIQGSARRSYLADTDNLVVNIEVTKVRDKGAVRRTYLTRKKLLDGIGDLRKGPTVAGHENVTCYRMPKGDKETIDGIACVAYAGEIAVTVDASGSKPLSPSRVGDLVKDQLDHIASPGEYI